MWRHSEHSISDQAQLFFSTARSHVGSDGLKDAARRRRCLCESRVRTSASERTTVAPVLLQRVQTWRKHAHAELLGSPHAGQAESGSRVRKAWMPTQAPRRAEESWLLLQCLQAPGGRAYQELLRPWAASRSQYRGQAAAGKCTANREARTESAGEEMRLPGPGRMATTGRLSGGAHRVVPAAVRSSHR